MKTSKKPAPPATHRHTPANGRVSIHNNWIGGREQRPVSGKYCDVRNPAT